jgi:hypothetical protein
MRIAIFSSAAFLTLHYFSHYFLKVTNFEKKIALNIKGYFQFSLQRMSETFFILRRTERDVIKNMHWSSWKQRSYYNNELKKPTRCTIVLKSLKLYCILIPLYMFRALLCPSSGASWFCTYSLQSPCVVGLVVFSSLCLSLLSRKRTKWKISILFGSDLYQINLFRTI